jgi:hypothetical protein
LHEQQGLLVGSRPPSEEAIYESPTQAGGIAGRGSIVDFFKASLENSDFQLALTAQFTGVNLVVTLANDGHITFLGVLRTNDHGQILEHLEATPHAAFYDSLSPRK